MFLINSLKHLKAKRSRNRLGFFFL